MSDRTLVAGVDSSTQSTKIVVCDAETGGIVRTARAPHPDGTEVDPERWWEAYEQSSGDGILDGVSAVAVGGQQHGMVTLDEHDDVVRDALLWNDTRSAGAAADLTAELGGAAAWVDAVGLVPVASFTVTKLRWFAEHEPERRPAATRVVLPHDWLTGRILKQGNGFERWTTDRGDASGTGYWSAGSNDYRLDLLKTAFGRELDVPEVLAPSAAAGHTDSGMLVAAGTGDNMGAALGLTLSPGDVVVSLGTSGTVFTPHDSAIRDETGAIAGFADATGRHLPLMCTLNAARVLGAAAAMIGVDLAGARPSRSRSRSRRRRPHPAALPRRGAHPRPARRDGHPERPHAIQRDTREPRTSRGRGHAVQPRGRCRCAPPARRRCRAGAAHRRRRGLTRRAGDRSGALPRTRRRARAR